jgi:bacterioferritin (cytochrome b1)
MTFKSGDPELDKLMEAAAAVRSMLIEEKKGVEDYDKLIAVLQEAGSIVGRAKAELIKQDEQKHVQWLDGALQLLNTAVKQHERAGNRERGLTRRRGV